MGDIIKSALEYYDKNSETYKHKFDDAVYVEFIKFTNDTEHNIIKLYDKNKELIFTSKFEVLGILAYNVWMWGWAMPRLRKNTTSIIRKIFNYGAELDPENLVLKTELITSRFRISSPIQTDIHVGIASYLSKKPLIYKHYSDIIYYTEQFSKIIKNPKKGAYIIHYLFLLDY